VQQRAHAQRQVTPDSPTVTVPQMVAINQALVHCTGDKDVHMLRAMLVSLQEDGTDTSGGGAGAGGLGGPLVLEA